MRNGSGKRGFGAAAVSAALLAAGASASLRAEERTTVDAEKERRQQVVQGFYGLQGQISGLLMQQWKLEDRSDEKQSSYGKKIDKARSEAVAKRLESLRASSHAALEREPWLREHLEADKMVDDGLHWVSRESVCTKLVVMSKDLLDSLVRQRTIQAEAEEQEKRKQLAKDQVPIDSLRKMASSIAGKKGGRIEPPGIVSGGGGMGGAGGVRYVGSTNGGRVAEPPEPPPMDVPPPQPVPTEKVQKAKRELREMEADIARLRGHISALNALDHIQDDMMERGFFWSKEVGVWAAVLE